MKHEGVLNERAHCHDKQKPTQAYATLFIGKLFMSIKKIFISVCCLFILFSNFSWAGESLQKLVDTHTSQYPGLTGTYILEKGEDALLARAWLADNAVQSIDVQYFIWSTDNIGILAAESLLRAAERGVKVRVIVDDLLVDASNKSLVALAAHPNISIKIYNPQHSVGGSLFTRLLHLVTNFRSFNQRMHNKIFIVDGKVGITGGRNMADEYFDFDHEYNFRDRDALLVGPVVDLMDGGFQEYWNSNLSVDVEELLGATDSWLTQKQTQLVYKELHDYANNTENFEIEIKERISNLLAEGFPALINKMVWTNVHFVSDEPGKNSNKFSLGGGGKTTHVLANLLRTAEKTITIQTPYLVVSEPAFTLFDELLKRGVKIRINMNSLPASDNLPSFSGYSKQREELIEMGIEIYEFKPYPALAKEIMQRYTKLKDKNPIFAIHAKTLVVDSETVFIGTYNLDPRSENLNTETGIYLYDKDLAREVEKSIENDMLSGNSWYAKEENGDEKAAMFKRTKNLLLQFIPLTPIL